MAESGTQRLASFKAPYPEPQENQKRCAIFLEEKEDENNLKVELIAGRNQTVDGVNHYFLTGSMKEEDVKGWAYPYYVVELGDCAQTLMGVMGDIPSQVQFVSISPTFIRYNSKLPIVVYIPKDAELRYRIWAPRSTLDTDPRVLEV